MTLDFFITISSPSRKILFTGIIPALFHVVKVVTILLSFQARTKISFLQYAIVDFLLNFFLLNLASPFYLLK